MYKYLIIILFSVFLTNCQHKENTVSLIKNGSSDYYIQLPVNEKESITYAATELNKYLQKSTGVELPIYGYNNKPSEGFAIFIDIKNSEKDFIYYKTQENAIHIGGNTENNCLYAVYDFLEKYVGCNWLSPSVEVIPDNKEIKIPADLNYEYSPPITTRTVHSKLFYEHHDYADKLHVTYEAFPGYVPEGRVHTFHRLVPENKYFKTHPEYYALRNGKRIPAQLCLTHPDVYKIIKTGVGDWFEQFPDANIVYGSQDDNQQYRQCDKCAE